MAATIEAAIAEGLAGGSVEDFTGQRDDPIYELGHAAARVEAAAEAAHNGPVPFVLTARAENYLHGRVDLADTIARLQAYQEAGADVLFAPRVVDPAELRQLFAAVDIPVSVLVTPDAPPIKELAELGVSRISVGGAIAVAVVRLRRRSRETAARRGDAQLLGHGRRRPRRHTGCVHQALSRQALSRQALSQPLSP